MKRDYLLIGVCQRPHGVKGEVLVKSLTDDDQRFFQGLTCTLLDHPDAPAGKSLTLSAARPVPQGLLLTFEGIMTREEARRLGRAGGEGGEEGPQGREEGAEGCAAGR